MRYIAAEDVAKAKEMDLLTYLRNYEPQELVHVSGNTYCTRDHDSLRISNGKRLGILEEPDMEEEGYNPLLHKFIDALTVYQQPTGAAKLWWLDEIEDADLIKSLMRLTDDELDLIDMLAFGGCSQREISERTGKSPTAICLKLKTIRKKVKKIRIRLNFFPFS